MLLPTYPVHLSHARGISIAENGKLNLNPFSPFIWKKHECEREIKHKKRESNDVRAPHQRTLNSESQKLFYEEVKEVEKITSKG